MKELSLYEIVTGILLFTESPYFSEQCLLGLFRELQREYPEDARRLRPEPLQQTLSFLEIYYVIIPPSVYAGGDTIYRINPDMRDCFREDLMNRKVLPRQEAMFRNLGRRLHSNRVA